MKKSQLVIIGVGIVVTVLLFNLPKALVAKKELAMEQEQEHKEEEHAGPEFSETHTVALKDAEAKKLDVLKKQLKSFSETEKKLIFADSIAKLFRNAGLFDSSAYYSGLMAEWEPNAANLEKAADAYYEAFSASGATKKEFNLKSQKYYEAVLAKNPANLELKAKFAMTFAATENPMKGITLLREVLTAEPENEVAMYNMGILSIQSGQYEKAVKRFQDLLKVNPMHANARFYLGLSYLNMGKKEKAKEEFIGAKKLEQDPAFQAIVDSYLKDIK